MSALNPILEKRLEELGIKPKIVFCIEPVAAPRMTQSDKWAKRPAVTKYFGYRNKLKLLANKVGYAPGGTLNVLFMFGMPVSWTKKKKAEMLYAPHQVKQRNDRDNLLKAFQDALCDDDGHVWDGRTVKIWGDKGMIIVF